MRRDSPVERSRRSRARPSGTRWRLVAGVALLAIGCKGGGSLDTGVVLATAGFVADDRPANVTSDYVSVRTSLIDESRIVLDLIITEVDQPITGIAVKLTYPEEFSKFVQCTDGELFPPGACFFAEPGPGSGEVFVARSVTDVAQATPAAGDQVVLRVEFLVFGVGQGPIIIEGQNLGGGDTSAVLDINLDPIFVQWFSGEILGM